MRTLGSVIAYLLLLIGPCTSFSPSATRHSSCEARRYACVQHATANDNNDNRNAVYDFLATPNETEPGSCNFFYTDEVMSHLHGYMLLFGLFAAQDEVCSRTGCHKD